MKGESERNGREVGYYRVVGAQGQILADCLAERQAQVFLRAWNSSAVSLDCPARLVELHVHPAAVPRAAG
jgi:hypothetical protein